MASTQALVVIDIQNDITKHYRDIIDNLNAAIDWATERGWPNARPPKRKGLEDKNARPETKATIVVA